MNPGPPEEPIEQLFRDVSGLADETARRITDAEVDARLDRLLMKYGKWAPILAIPAMVFLGAWSCHSPDSVQVCSGGKCATVAPGSPFPSSAQPSIPGTTPNPTVTCTSDCDH